MATQDKERAAILGFIFLVILALVAFALSDPLIVSLLDGW